MVAGRPILLLMSEGYNTIVQSLNNSNKRGLEKVHEWRCNSFFLWIMFCWHRFIIIPTWHRSNCVKVSDVAGANVEVKIWMGKYGSEILKEVLIFEIPPLTLSLSLCRSLSPSVYHSATLSFCLSLSHSLILLHCLRSLALSALVFHSVLLPAPIFRGCFFFFFHKSC